MKIVVLGGGLSNEREVSLASATLICKSLRKQGYKAIVVDSYLGIPNITDDLNKVFENFEVKEYKISENAPSLVKIKEQRNKKIRGYFGENVLKLCQEADKIFIALHGADGESGKVQACFDLLDIKYTGTGYLGSALALNKDLAKQIMIASGVEVPAGYLIKKDTLLDLDISYPAVIKPADGGSSVGISIINNEGELNNSLDNAFLFTDEVLIENYIKGREFSVGILNNETLPVIEIIPLKGFYDYKNKYQANLTKEICPADLNDDQTLELQKIALKVHNILKLGKYSRIDFLLDENNKFYCLEANTLPGMTATSLLPQEAKVVGYSFDQLCTEILKID